MYNIPKGLIELEKVATKNGYEYTFMMLGADFYLLSETESFKNLLYSKEFSDKYLACEEELENLEEYNWTIIAQEFKTDRKQTFKNP